jgi:hypothetical protein
MSLVLTNTADKAKSIDVIRLLMEQFMFPVVDPAARRNLIEHIAWMRRQVPDMKVDLEFETFPATQTTIIQLAISFAGNAPRAIQ